MDLLARLPDTVKPDLFMPFMREDLEGSIVDRFEGQVALHPDRPAVNYDHHQLTYRELNKAANQLAHRILEMTAGSSEPVAFLIGFGISQIVAIFGILKAGKAYVGLDPDLPRARLEFMLADSQSPILVTNSENLALVEEFSIADSQILNTDELDPALPGENLGLKITPESFAAIQYTSGSTGEPKGVIVNHKALMHHIMIQTNRRFYHPDDRCILVKSIAFGASAAPIFGALLNGACLYPFDIKQKGLLALLDFLEVEAITVFAVTPSTFRIVASLLIGDHAFPNMRFVVFGGETVLKVDVDMFQKISHPDCFLEVHFAGTEFLGASALIISRDTRLQGDLVPVGYPIPDKGVVLLDENGDQVPQGEVGEITLRSQFISPGYWRKPELTKAAFIPVPGQDGLIQYRTGDLGRMGSDGCLEHLGRKDRQVKIRGYRVELAEVTSALVEIPTIEDAHVLARQDSTGEVSLVAYLVLEGKATQLPENLRQRLSERLPTYMQPSKFILLESLPRTPTGKIDALALSEIT